MPNASSSLMSVYEGWDSHQLSLVRAIAPLSRQWTIWRIMAHDLHHGGQLAILLGIQGIEIPELGDLGGHLTEPPVVGTT